MVVTKMHFLLNFPLSNKLSSPPWVSTVYEKGPLANINHTGWALENYIKKEEQGNCLAWNFIQI